MGALASTVRLRGRLACSTQPLSRGHVLVIPKQRAAQLHELDEEHAAALGRALPRVARAVMRATGCEHYNVLQNNGAPAHQAVFHVHFHVIPRVGERGLGVGWEPTDLEGGEELAASLRAALEAEVQA